MPISECYNEDCMIGMKRYEDKFFDLAVVDPQYGIGRDGGETGKNWKWYEPKDWDNERPSKEYFIELERVSVNRIIWGANYFSEYLPSSMGWIFWDKGQDLTMSDGELAYSSFDRALRRITINRCKIGEHGGLLHPTQKPVKLYRWLLENYATCKECNNTGKVNGGSYGMAECRSCEISKKGISKILDTHMGSQSSRIAAFNMGFDYYGWEIDKEYFDKGNKRFKEQTMQLKIF